MEQACYMRHFDLPSALLLRQRYDLECDESDA
jgi:hypothetical protein